MTLYVWAALVSAVILMAVGGLLAYQFGYSKGWRDARKGIRQEWTETNPPSNMANHQDTPEAMRKKLANMEVTSLWTSKKS